MKEEFLGNFCKQCLTILDDAGLDEYEGVDEYMYHCPKCSALLGTAPYEKEEEYELSADELRYTIHSLGKQLMKVENARNQLYSTLGKLEVQLEVAKERENQ